MSLTETTSAHHFSESDDVGQNIARVVKLLRAAREISNDEIIDGVGIPKSTLYRRLKDGEFTGPELVRLGKLFGVAPSIFFEPVEDLVRSR